MAAMFTESTCFIRYTADRNSAFGVRRSAFGVRRSAFGVRRSAFGVRRSAFGVRRSAFCIRRSAFGKLLLPLSRVRLRKRAGELTNLTRTTTAEIASL